MLQAFGALLFLLSGTLVGEAEKTVLSYVARFRRLLNDAGNLIFKVLLFFVLNLIGGIVDAVVRFLDCR